MTRGIMLDPRVRRWAMFILMLTALAMVFAGWIFLRRQAFDPMGLHDLLGCLHLVHARGDAARPLGYVLMRVAARKERRKLEKQIFGRPPDDKP